MRTIEHTIPSGETITFSVRVTDADALKATIGYPSIDEGGPDLSAYASDDAYPVAEIEAAVSDAVGYPVAFRECTYAGEDAGAYECWRFRPAATGREAVALAEKEGFALRKHADPVDGARLVTVEEALAICEEDPGLIYCTV